MSDWNHSLYTDFPQYRERIHQLKLESPEFAAKAAEYHKLDHSVRGHEMAHIPITNDEFTLCKTFDLNCNWPYMQYLDRPNRTQE